MLELSLGFNPEKVYDGYLQDNPADNWHFILLRAGLKFEFISRQNELSSQPRFSPRVKTN